MRVALIGTRGVPARYGGFETAVEEVGKRLVAMGHDVVVYTRNREAGADYLGMRLVYLPTIATKFTDTLVHTALSTVHASACLRPDAAIIFNAANAPVAPALRLMRIPYAVHVDGLEWKRAKWNGVAKKYYLQCERIAARTASALIADSRGIVAYYQDRYGLIPDFIAYGAPRVSPSPESDARLAGIGIRASQYHLVVARFEPENHVYEIVQAYSRSDASYPLVVVGSAPYAAEYTHAIQDVASNDSRIHLIGAVWDQGLLDDLYAGCLTYIHGHSVGGTNPSLLRAVGAAAPVIACDVSFNREVTTADGVYFRTRDDLTQLIDHAEGDEAATRERGVRGQAQVLERYDWDDVARAYEALCSRLVSNYRPALTETL
jgi:glycosyltransferase involved in cell wall biosynthesis